MQSVLPEDGLAIVVRRLRPGYGADPILVTTNPAVVAATLLAIDESLKSDASALEPKSPASKPQPSEVAQHVSS